MKRKLIEDCDYFVRYVPFPTDRCGGMSVLNEDDTYSVYLNSNPSHDRQKKAFEHEIDHIENEDIHSDKPIQEIEKQCRVTGK